MKPVLENALKYPEYKLTKPVRLIELFAGYGSQAMAFKKAEIPFESHYVCEFDKNAVKSYNAVHGTDVKPVDIRDVHASDFNITDTDKYTYFLTYSFPCQSLSRAGKQGGMKKGSGTRSSLLWEVERLLNECKAQDTLPDVLMLENVPMIIKKKVKQDFDVWLRYLENLGYSNHYAILNARDYNVPQNRERFFMLSFKGKYDYAFPKPVPLTLGVKDIMEDHVDESYNYVTKKTNVLRNKLLENIASGKTIEPSAICEERTAYGKAVRKSYEHGGDVIKEDMRRYILRTDNASNTITTIHRHDICFDKQQSIRYFTPKECLRLMGVESADADKILSAVSRSSAFKQAGNSIVVDVMAAMFRKLK